jgi:amidohydrolase
MQDRAHLVALRHELHRFPEVSGDEAETARRIADTLRAHRPDQLLTGLGGHGIAAVFNGAGPGPTVLIRAELDGLPIEEISTADYRSQHTGFGHLCGHDGHMVMVVALAEQLAQQRPACGRVVLAFQPAEETGKGAAAFRADPRFSDIAPDYAFSLHNLPGLALGEVRLCAAAANCASRGMRISLMGKTSHAAAPGDGLSPMEAMAALMPSLITLGQGGALNADYALVTLTHARLGEATFGIAPGAGEIWATLRTVNDTRMTQLCEAAEALVQAEATRHGLTLSISYDDIFEACENHPVAVGHLQSALTDAGVAWQMTDAPQRWSEDFGQFAKGAKSAMFWLGSGENQPQLHNPDYDFPDALIPTGAGVFLRLIRNILG